MTLSKSLQQGNIVNPMNINGGVSEPISLISNAVNGKGARDCGNAAAAHRREREREREPYVLFIQCFC